MHLLKCFLAIVLFLMPGLQQSFAATETDSIVLTASRPWKHDYTLKGGKVVHYEMPKLFDFVKRVPGDMYGFCKYSVREKSIPWIGIIAMSSGILIDNDQNIYDATLAFSDRNGIDRREKYNNLFAPKLSGSPVRIIAVPENLNTLFYTLGQGYPALMVGGGLFYWGMRHHDVRAVSTASQLAESFIAMGLATQIVKRITGRETPGESTRESGAWRPFPSFSAYMKHTPKYDAFPSGHLATVVCAFTVLAENYPEKKWLKPLAYGLSGLVSAAMINNGVHWAGDYPLAIGIGYGFGKVVSARSKTFTIVP